MHFFSKQLWSSGQLGNDAKTLFSILHHLFLVILANTTALAFVLLRNSRYNFHCYAQREPTSTQTSTQKWQLWPFATPCGEDYKGHSLVQTSLANCPILSGSPPPPPPCTHSCRGPSPPDCWARPWRFPCGSPSGRRSSPSWPLDAGAWSCCGWPWSAWWRCWGPPRSAAPQSLRNSKMQCSTSAIIALYLLKWSARWHFGACCLPQLLSLCAEAEHDTVQVQLLCHSC